MAKPISIDPDSAKSRRAFLHSLKEMGGKEVEYRLSSNKFNSVQANIAKQWIADSANGLTLEDDLRHIVDQLEIIKTKFKTRGPHLVLPVESAAKAKALFVEADQLATLGIRIGNPSLSHLQSRVVLMTNIPLVGYSYDYIAEMTELILCAASALRLPVSIPPHVNQSTQFVNKSIIADLMARSTARYDTSQLVRFCEELNSAYASGNFYSCAMLTRAIIDHVSPLFGGTDFKSIVANWPKGAVKTQLQHLDSVAKQLGHIVLHTQIGSELTKVSHTSIDCKQALDALLRECLRKLQTSVGVDK